MPPGRAACGATLFAMTNTSGLDRKRGTLFDHGLQCECSANSLSPDYGKQSYHARGCPAKKAIRQRRLTQGQIDTIFWAFDEQGYSIGAIADLLKCSRGTVQHRLRAAGRPVGRHVKPGGVVVPEHLRSLVRWRLVASSKKKGLCRMWTGSCGSDGYGQMRLAGVRVAAHRVAYAVEHSETVPAGALVLHRCDQPRCVRADHLYLGDHRDNAHDFFARGGA